MYVPLSVVTLVTSLFPVLGAVHLRRETSAVWDDAGLSQSSQGRVFRAKHSRQYTGQLLFQDDIEASASQHLKVEGQRECQYWAVITSIFEPTLLVEQLMRLSDEGWCTVVVGDKNGPTTYDVPGDDKDNPIVTYLTPSMQEDLPYLLREKLKWNHFGRKNLGFLYAIHHGAEFIYDTDDDNALHRAGGKVLIKRLIDAQRDPERKTETVVVDENVYTYNPYMHEGYHVRLDAPDGAKSGVFVWPRGYPLDLIGESRERIYSGPTPANSFPTIMQSLADHDPDVDGIYRLTRRLPIVFGHGLSQKTKKNLNLVIPRGVMTPFNAQATLYSKEAFWGLLLPVSVHGRVTDIWRSYFAQRIMFSLGQSLMFTSPFVTQCRNAHSYLADFNSESDLYTKSGELVRLLLAWQPRAQTVAGQLEELAVLAYETNLIGLGDIEVYQAWIGDLLAMGYEFPELPTNGTVFAPVQHHDVSIPVVGKGADVCEDDVRKFTANTTKLHDAGNALK
jgi:hypothetical protein